MVGVVPTANVCLLKGLSCPLTDHHLLRNENINLNKDFLNEIGAGNANPCVSNEDNPSLNFTAKKYIPFAIVHLILVSRIIDFLDFTKSYRDI